MLSSRKSDGESPMSNIPAQAESPPKGRKLLAALLVGYVLG